MFYRSHNDNIPASAIGVPAPWDEQDLDMDLHPCDGGCKRLVENLGDWCDHCTVANAEACGDWSEEAMEAKERIDKAA